MKIEVVEIYPFPSLEGQKKNVLEIGTVHIFIEDLGIDLRNIIYRVTREKGKEDTKKVFVQLPFKMHYHGDKKNKTFVPYIDFKDKSIKDEIIKIVRKEVLENL